MDEKVLASRALQARKLAYAPYSGFLVGASLLCEDGTVYDGGNIENGAYTPSNCAERTAFFAAIREGHRGFSAIAVAGAPKEQEIPHNICPPCGVCLQVMAEFCDPDTFRIILVKNETEYQVHLLRELLPFGFRLNEADQRTEKKE
ncbi:MAG: cytidine deaminase [Massiliimalia sp.]|jgi:cytidine deaminase